jgi:RNA-directed DNA polymerase
MHPLTHPDSGTSQRGRSPSSVVRFANDFFVILANRDDAERASRVLGRRLGKYRLELPPDEPQMIAFRFQPQSGYGNHQERLATTFNFSYSGSAPSKGIAVRERVSRKIVQVNDITCITIRSADLCVTCKEIVALH